jgi:fluoride exporter
MSQLFFIAIGAVIGALSRFFLGIWLNPFFPTLFLGTLFVNLLGGYLIGLVMGAHLFSEPLRLLIVTGFLGSFTTFSTFSYEALTLLFHQEFLWAMLHIFFHVFGAICMTFLGYATIKVFQVSS